jgi:hypothetical protein
VRKTALPGVAAERYQSADALARELRLCLNPRCWELLQPPRRKLGRFILKWPVIAGIIAGLVPNSLTALFNYTYNRDRMGEVGTPLRDKFDDVQVWINIVAFTVGIVGGAWLTVRAVRFVNSTSAEPSPDAAGKVLSFSRIVSCLVVALWTCSGLVFPIALVSSHTQTSGVGFFLHFFASLALCGFAATAYPYFLITAGLVHYFLPQMIRSGTIPGPRRSDLAQLRKYNWIHFGMAMFVPLLGVLMMNVFGNTSQFALAVVSGGGVAALALCGLLFWQIELDAGALAHMAVDERRSAGRSRSSRGSSAGSQSSRPPA